MSNLKREAAYMYIESRKLLKLNEKIKDISAKAHHLKEKTIRTTEPHTQQQKQREYEKVTRYLHKLAKEHNDQLSKLRFHHLNFQHLLHQEHNTRK